MKLTQRQVVLCIQSLLAAGMLLALLYQLFSPGAIASPIVTAGALLMTIVLLAAYWRGWEPARYLTLVLVTVAIVASTSEPYLHSVFSTAAFVPPLLAMIVGGPVWVLGTAVVVIGSLAIKAGGQSIYTDPLALIIFAIIIGSAILARIVTDTAQRAAEEQARRAEEALAVSEAQGADLARKAEELASQNEEQRRLLGLVATLETPAVTLADGVLLAPIVGNLDSRRADLLTERLLREVADVRARLVILDVAGVPAMDTAVAQALLRAIQAVRLLGCDVTVTGISASVAATMTYLGINMTGVRTARTPQEALEHANVGVQPSMDGVRRN